MTRENGPPPPANPPGLNQIAYRVADFAAFRRALLTPLAGEQQLTTWSPGPGDLGLQVLEWWAYLGDILTFYNERIANNSYLQTAAAQPGPQNAAGLARLLGYRTAPAITATGFIAAIRSASARDGKLAIPAGLQVTSTPTAEAPAQLFEVTDNGEFPGPTDAIIGIQPDPDLFQSSPADASAPGTVLLAGQVTVQSGEQLVLVKRGWEGTTGEWAVATAASAATETEPDGTKNTRLTLNPADWHSLAGDGTAEPVPIASDYQLQRAPATALLWTIQASGGGGGQSAGPTLSVPLAALARNVSPGDNVLFTGSAGGTPPQTVQLVAHVTGVSEEVRRVPPPSAGDILARPAPDVYIQHTILTVATAGADTQFSALRSALGTSAAGGIVMRYGFRDVAGLIPTPAKVLDKFPATVAVPAGLPAPGGKAALTDANGAGLMVTAAVTKESGSVVLTPVDDGSAAPGPSLTSAPSPSLTAPVRLLVALVPVSRGTTVASEILGDGDPTATGQAFVLQQSPLIYLPPADDPVSTLSVSVNGFPWTEVMAFSGQAPDARVYVVSELPDGSVQVRFGDGINGARLPLGSGNVTAAYRYGSPATAPPVGSLTTVLQPQPNLATVLNPLPIIPGTDPEPAGKTAEDAPGTVVMFSRATSAAAPLISLDDSERLAAIVTGVTRVRAYWT